MTDQIEVPNSLVELGAAVITLRGPFGVPGGFKSQRDEIRGVLEAVLPLHEDRVRERLAVESADAAAGSYASRACAWPACLTEAQQLELAENVHRSMLGEDTGPDPLPDCECPERLRTELNAATARAEQAEAEVKWLRDTNRKLAKDVLRALKRATTAEAALAEMRERLGVEREQWGVRMRDTDPAEDIEVMSSEAVARELAATWRDEVPDANPTAMVRTRCEPGPWRVAPRTALERAAEGQGDGEDNEPT